MNTPEPGEIHASHSQLTRSLFWLWLLAKQHFESLLISSVEIKSRVRALAALVHRDYKGKRPVLVCTLKGACPFFSLLVEELQELRQGFDLEFVRASSYRGTSSTGVVSMLLGELNLESLKNRSVLIVEDIVDTGQTLSSLVPVIKEKGQAERAEVITLVDKRLDSPKKYAAKWVGFSIPDAFIVGFGLDYNELYRDLKDIFVISKAGIDFDATLLHK